MNTYTGWQHLLINLATHYGHDKMTFEERIAWSERNLTRAESLAHAAAEEPLYLKTCMAIRDAQAGEPSGHMVAVDAVCSGIQIMSALTGCENGARATGMVDPDRRADAYSDVTDTMNVRLLAAGIAGVTATRGEVKYAVMTTVYGSKAVPKQLFGDETPELDAFRNACWDVAPGAFELLGELMDTWQPYALSHQWILPDNFHAKIKVMTVVEKEGIEVDELNHATFTYQYRVNQGQETGLSNVANVVHSIDAYVLRSLVRRCNYDPELVDAVQKTIAVELLNRAAGSTICDLRRLLDDQILETYAIRYARTGMVEVQMASLLTEDSVKGLTTQHLRALSRILCQMLEHEPCPVITVHDSFAAHPNHIDTVRYWYKEIMAELAESSILDDIFNQLVGQTGTYVKKTPNLAAKIRQSNYALC